MKNHYDYFFFGGGGRETEPPHVLLLVEERASPKWHLQAQIEIKHLWRANSE